ncbi:MAG: hypothetical protein EOP88_02345 [Verrucomicrobiaceae bacterium]|nr:MAG: hypothetical protein EOP88_02345 [Verrucomicrobiaceae bacterium]
MFVKYLIALPALVLALPAAAQDLRMISARVVYFQEAADNPPDLFFASAGGEFGKIRPSAGVGEASAKVAVDAAGQVSFLKTAAAGNPVAIAKVPNGITEAVFFLLRSPAASGQSPSYKVLVADESQKTIPRGGSFVCNIGGSGARVSLGEAKYALPPGQPAYVKRPEKRDGYNMAAFHVESQEGSAWKPVKDTMIRFSENERYFFIIYSEAGGAASVKIYKQFIPVVTPGSAPAAGS